MVIRFFCYESLLMVIKYGRSNFAAMCFSRLKTSRGYVVVLIPQLSRA